MQDEDEPDSDEQDVDIFETGLTSLFDELPVATTPRWPNHYIKHSQNIKLYLPDVNTEKERLLQSHLLWPAAVRMASMVENGRIDVRDQSVLELGAGAGLPSLTATLHGAAQVVVTDYPSPAILSIIQKNVDINISSSLRSQVYVVGLDWTDAKEALLRMQEIVPRGFQRILLADTLWMSGLHAVQLSVITSSLALTPSASIHLIAGLHTGRACVSHFLLLAMEAGLEMRYIREIPRVSDNSEGSEEGREWVDREDGLENERRKWLVSAVLGWSAQALTSSR